MLSASSRPGATPRAGAVETATRPRVGRDPRKARTHAGWSTLSLADVLAGVGVLRRLPAFLRNPLTLDGARAALRVQLAHRETAFLTHVRQGIFESPASPYHPLLVRAGCAYGDLERAVRRDGVDDALHALFRAGVYLSVSEFKGRQPVRRGATVVDVDPSRLTNPGSARHVPLQTSGSRSNRTPVVLDLAFIRECAGAVLLWLHARGAVDSVKAHWQVPGSGSIARLLEYAAFSPPVRWFSPLEPTAAALPALHRWSGTALRWGSRLGGVPLPGVEYVPFDDPAPIVEWLAAVIRAGRTPHLHTWPSSAGRLAQMAAASGVDIAGTQFTVSGEPITEAKVAVLRRAGAQAWPRYGSVEVSGIGVGCAAPAHCDDVHLLHDGLAMIQPGAGHELSGLPADALLVSSLRPTAPIVLLNVSLGDRATLDSRACGCPLEALGWTTHLHTVRSYEKLTAGGMTFLDADVIRILEAVLPSRFGGAPTDYQLVEDEAATGAPSLRLLVRPEVGPVDPGALIEAFLDALAEESPAARVMAAQWREAGIVRVDRRAPVTTASGKILHLVAASTTRSTTS